MCVTAESSPILARPARAARTRELSTLLLSTPSPRPGHHALCPCGAIPVVLLPSPFLKRHEAENDAWIQSLAMSSRNRIGDAAYLYPWPPPTTDLPDRSKGNVSGMMSENPKKRQQSR
ncbi:MAG: hypothetical protein M1823_002618 [Watsoniomyces obsoletus]|nr:MAG: hypothetical protein M1823_002618 [Watsoniomyces obsoletus]